MSKKKIETLRFNLRRLQEKHHGLKVQVDAAQCCGRSHSDDKVVSALKSQKLACKDEIARLERQIVALQAKPAVKVNPAAGQPIPVPVEECQDCEPIQQLRSIAA